MRRAVVVALALVSVATPAASAPAAQGPAIPILMYHVIAAPPPGAPFPALYVRPAEFAAEMKALARDGYHAITLTQAYGHWIRGARIPSRPIVITFDDGYRSVYENAFPILRAHGWPGVLNLELRFMDRSWGLARSRIRRLLATKWELASHTISHRDLTTLSARDLEHEVLDSRFDLQRIFHVPVAFFCYPAGRYNATVIAAVRAAGYQGATSTRLGLGRPDELFTLARIRVSGGDGTAGLMRELRRLRT
jgi:peptidoglycan/xylan/chitin deacetylase (PgdA/CDA1 family)